MTANGTAPWHVVQRVGRSDRYALDWLEKLGREVYYPMVRELRAIPRNRLSRRQRQAGVAIVRPAVVPFFPGYLFVRFDIARDDWHGLADIAGIGGLACKDNLPVMVSDALIAAIRVREVGGVVPGKTPARLIFALGERVRIKDGPFAAFTATVGRLPDLAIEDIDSATRIGVALDLFGRTTPVDLDIGQIEKLQPPGGHPSATP